MGKYGLAWVVRVSQKTETDGCQAPAGSGGASTSLFLPSPLLSLPLSRAFELYLDSPLP